MQTPPPPCTPNSVLEGAQTAWAGLDATLDPIPDAVQSEPGCVGVWSVKDVVAHIAFWNEWGVDAAATLLSGVATDEGDWQALNDRVAAERAPWSPAAARAALTASEQAVSALVAALPAAGAHLPAALEMVWTPPTATTATTSARSRRGSPPAEREVQIATAHAGRRFRVDKPPPPAYHP
ncbi:MAG: DinB family protein [Thermomicrobiales bacterium]